VIKIKWNFIQKRTQYITSVKKKFLRLFWPLIVSALQKTQSVCIHDMLNTQGFAMYYRAISNTISHLQVLRWESFTAKQKDTLLSFMLNDIEAKIFHYVYLEGRND